MREYEQENCKWIYRDYIFKFMQSRAIKKTEMFQVLHKCWVSSYLWEYRCT
jgi:hypothetical protein